LFRREVLTGSVNYELVSTFAVCSIDKISKRVFLQVTGLVFTSLGGFNFFRQRFYIRALIFFDCLDLGVGGNLIELRNSVNKATKE